MKNYYLLIVLLLLGISCNSDHEESFKENNTSKHYSLKSISVNNDLSTIVLQLINAYNINLTNNSTNGLFNKIALLDSISSQNIKFEAIKPVNYSLITVTDAQNIIYNYNEKYLTLHVSLVVKDYFNAVIQENNLDNLITAITADEELTVNDKDLLFFIISCLENTPPGSNNNDVDWKKKMIVSATLGFKESNANAVFNVALMHIAN